MKVYIDYRDGQYSLHRFNSGEIHTNISIWQWWLYCAYRWIDSKMHRWISKLDNDAYEKRDKGTVL